jgi:hypothetical protein
MNYYEVPRISNTSLSCIDPETGGHPQKHRDFMDGKYKIESPSLSLGDLIHRRLLLNEEFVSFEKMPGEAIKAIIEAYVEQQLLWNIKEFKIDSDKALLLQLIREHGYYNNRKDDTVLDGVIKEGREYSDFLLQNAGKTVVSWEWMAIIEKIEANTCREPIRNLLYPEEVLSQEVMTEKEIYFDLELKNFERRLQSFDCKAKLDRLIVDHEKRSFKLVDIKSTGTPLEQFHKSVEKYKYYRQLSFYVNAAQYMLPPGYCLDGVYIVAVETSGYCRSRLFQLDSSYLEKGEKNLFSLLKRISFHQATGNWTDLYEELFNKGIYILKVSDHHQPSNTLSFNERFLAKQA